MKFGKMIKKVWLFLLLLFTIIFLAGCWDQKELNDLALVMAAGIDENSDGMIELTVLVFIPKGNGSQQGMEGGGGGAGTAETLVRSSKGRTIAEAMSTLQEKLPRHIFWGHCKVFIFDEGLAKDDLNKQIDFILRHPQLRERSQLFISEEKSKDILSLIPPLERDISEVLRELSTLRIGMEVTTKDYGQMILNDSNASAIPLIKILPPDEKEDKKNQSIAYINGTAIFQDGKMVGKINDSVTRGVLWLRDEIRLATISIKPNIHGDGIVTTNLLKASSKITPSISDGKWKIHLDAFGNTNIVQNTTDLDMSDPKIVKYLEGQLEVEIRKKVKTALNKVQKDLHTDIFGFAEAFHRKYPKRWEKEKDRWNEIFPTVEVSVDAKMRIQNPGMNSIISRHPLKEVDLK